MVAPGLGAGAFNLPLFTEMNRARITTVTEGNIMTKPSNLVQERWIC